MNVITVRGPQVTKEKISRCNQLDGKIKSIGYHLKNLKSLLNRVSFMVPRHYFDKLTALENKYLYLQQDMITCLMFKDFGLYEPTRINSPYHEDRIDLEVQGMEVQLIQFRSTLFTKNKFNTIL